MCCGVAHGEMRRNESLVEEGLGCHSEGRFAVVATETFSDFLIPVSNVNRATVNTTG